MNGLIVINKPSGLTSHRVVQEIRRLIPETKVGHAGTLDPLATGVLPLCLGKATRIVEYLMDLPKGYRAELEFGATTETGDAQGEIINRFPLPPLTRDMVEQALIDLTGTQQQVPPRYSAIKYRGKPMYYWTRQGIEVELSPRTVHIYRLEMIDFRYPERPQLVIETECSRGTYIRVLAEQIGEKLGTGAFVRSLQRLFVGPFTLKQSVDLDYIQRLAGLAELKEMIIPADRALQHLPAVTLDDVGIRQLQQGQTVALNEDPEGAAEGRRQGKYLRVYNPVGLFTTLAVVNEVAGEKLLKPVINF